MIQEPFFRPAKEIIDDLSKSLRASIFGCQVRSIDIRATDFPPLHDSLACQAVHDGHDCGVSARTALGKAIANIADGAFPRRPQRVHAIELQRSEIEDRSARGCLLGIFDGVSPSFHDRRLFESRAAARAKETLQLPFPVSDWPG